MIDPGPSNPENREGEANERPSMSHVHYPQWRARHKTKATACSPPAHVPSVAASSVEGRLRGYLGRNSLVDPLADMTDPNYVIRAEWTPHLETPEKFKATASEIKLGSTT